MTIHSILTITFKGGGGNGGVGGEGWGFELCLHMAWLVGSVFLMILYKKASLVHGNAKTFYYYHIFGIFENSWLLIEQTLNNCIDTYWVVNYFSSALHMAGGTQDGREVDNVDRQVK